MGRRRRSGIPGLSFSWKRALGITSAKRRIAKATGIPTTRTGRRNKMLRMLTGGGCIVPMLCITAIIVAFFLIML